MSEVESLKLSREIIELRRSDSCSLLGRSGLDGLRVVLEVPFG